MLASGRSSAPIPDSVALMLRTTLFVGLCVFAACGKGDDKKGGDKAAPADNKPKEMSATDLWNDYNKPGQDGMALLEKWRAGVIVNGTVKSVMGENSVWLDAGGKNMQLDFADAAALQAKGVKAGDTVVAQCKIGGSDGSNLMMLTDCALK